MGYLGEVRCYEHQHVKSLVESNSSGHSFPNSFLSQMLTKYHYIVDVPLETLHDSKTHAPTTRHFLRTYYGPEIVYITYLMLEVGQSRDKVAIFNSWLLFKDNVYRETGWKAIKAISTMDLTSPCICLGAMHLLMTEIFLPSVRDHDWLLTPHNKMISASPLLIWEDSCSLREDTSAALSGSLHWNIFNCIPWLCTF